MSAADSRTVEERLIRPIDSDAAVERIEALCREIEILCDEFNLDPTEWLQDGYVAREPDIFEDVI